MSEEVKGYIAVMIFLALTIVCVAHVIGVLTTASSGMIVVVLVLMGLSFLIGLT
jgi:hypothetical protein